MEHLKDNQLEEAHSKAKNYPDLIKKLKEIGVKRK